VIVWRESRFGKLCRLARHGGRFIEHWHQCTPGRVETCKNGAVERIPPIRFADILFAKVTDPHGKIAKTRRGIFLTTRCREANSHDDRF
jgi:hypothetical protein